MFKYICYLWIWMTVWGFNKNLSPYLIVENCFVDMLLYYFLVWHPWLCVTAGDWGRKGAIWRRTRALQEAQTPTAGQPGGAGQAAVTASSGSHAMMHYCTRREASGNLGSICRMRQWIIQALNCVVMWERLVFAYCVLCILKWMVSTLGNWNEQ